ncbi:MAG: 30S ribosomal protein S9 [Candidatus Liptonbacteria bacterium]|nr:30S ribosomal protein S9 [Candidatus Liptonbacteria bacterium]
MAKRPEPQSYIEAIGRRKTAVARVRVHRGESRMTINDTPYQTYFPIARQQKTVRAPLALLNETNIAAAARVRGGGIQAQAEAVRLGLSRALLTLSENDAAVKVRLRAAGFLTRDARMVERKKPGLKKARRAPQWAKR